MAKPSTVARLLTRAFAAQALLIVVSGLSGVGTVMLQHQTVKQLTDHVLPLQLANADLRAVMSDGQRGLRGYLLTGDSTLLGSYYAARSDYHRSAQELRQLAYSSERPAIEEQVDRAAAWWTVAELQRQAVPRSAEAAEFVTQGWPRFVSFESANFALDNQLGARADSRQGTKGANCFSLLADDLADVIRRDAHLDQCRAIALVHFTDVKISAQFFTSGPSGVGMAMAP